MLICVIVGWLITAPDIKILLVFLPKDSFEMTTKGSAILYGGPESEKFILEKFGNEIPHYLGACTDQCTGCGALHWRAERRKRHTSALPHVFSVCCQQGAVSLPVKHFGRDVVPGPLKDLMTGQSQRESLGTASPSTKTNELMIFSFRLG